MLHFVYFGLTFYYIHSQILQLLSFKSGCVKGIYIYIFSFLYHCIDIIGYNFSSYSDVLCSFGTWLCFHLYQNIFARRHLHWLWCILYITYFGIVVKVSFHAHVSVVLCCTLLFSTILPPSEARIFF